MTQQTPNLEDRFLISSDQVSQGQYREALLETDDRTLWLVLTRHHGQPRAWLNVCPHAGRALNWAPDKFLTDDTGNLVCAAHGAVFEPGEGRCIRGPCAGAALTCVEVDERDGRILLQRLPKMR